MNLSPAHHRHVDNPAAAQSWPVAFPVQKRIVAGTATCWVAKCLIRPVPVSVGFFFRLQDGCRVVDNFVLFEKETLLQEAKILIHRINLQREIYGEFFHLVDEVLIDEKKCLSYIRIRPCTFHSLLHLISPYIIIRETNFRKPTPASVSVSVSILN